MKAIFVGGKFNGLICDVDELELLTEWTGEYSKDYSRERQAGMLVRRAELDNKPLISGYLTPMWDGEKIRYETQEVYNALSV